MDQVGNGLSGLLKLLYWLVIAVAVLWFCFKYAGPILAAIRGFLADMATVIWSEKNRKYLVAKQKTRSRRPLNANRSRIM